MLEPKIPASEGPWVLKLTHRKKRWGIWDSQGRLVTSFPLRREADARLIAKSPMMRDLLKHAVEALTGTGGS